VFVAFKIINAMVVAIFAITCMLHVCTDFILSFTVVITWKS